MSIKIVNGYRLTFIQFVAEQILTQWVEYQLLQHSFYWPASVLRIKA